MYILDGIKRYSPNVFFPFIYTVANTGARRGEVVNLLREDIDFATGLIHLRQTKNGEDRSIRISQNLTQVLKDHLATHTSDYAFPNEKGEMLGRSQIQKTIVKFQKHFPLEKEWGLHALRHSFAYNYLKKGGEMYQLQAVLGHKHIQVTVDLYGQLKAQDVENVSPYES